MKMNPALVILPYIDAGFPNVVIEALLAGCPVTVHDKFPFRYLPIHGAWRFKLLEGALTDDQRSLSDLEVFLDGLLREQRDFAKDNKPLIELVESDWERRVWEVFE